MSVAGLWPPPKTITRRCAICRAEFAASPPNKRCCSEPCRTALTRSNQKRTAGERKAKAKAKADICQQD